MNIKTNIPAGKGLGGGLWPDWSRAQIGSKGVGICIGEWGPDWGLGGSGQMGAGARLGGWAQVRVGN